MNPFFSRITDENKLSLNKPVDSDRVYYSELNEWFTSNAFRSFSIKYVLDNHIHYKVGKKQHLVQSGDFLLACKQPYVNAYFESEKPVKSICIDIRPETVNEAFTVMSSREGHDFDNYLSSYFKQPDFFESVCPVKSATSLNQKLNKLAVDIYNGNVEGSINKEWFLDLVERVVYHEFGNYLALNGIHSAKPETKKEILKRLKIARQYMDENYLQVEDIAEVAAVCNFSEFHFFRSFRQAFNITPYQYLLQKRLGLSMSLLQTREFSLSKIALHCSFPDLATFSKAFKRQYGVAPAHYSLT